MTFVRAKLQVEKMKSGELVEIRIGAGEPLENVPRSLRAEGHEIVDLSPEGRSDTRIFRLLVRKV